jgi:hypothetical protein
MSRSAGVTCARAPVRSADYCRVETEGDEEPRTGDALACDDARWVRRLFSLECQRWAEPRRRVLWRAKYHIGRINP